MPSAAWRRSSADAPARSGIVRPGARVIVNTRSDDSSPITRGTRITGSPAHAAANLSWLAASARLSSSPRTASPSTARPRASSVAPIAAPASWRTKPASSRSARSASAMPGDWTLTTTAGPSCSIAAWTWPSDAAASGGDSHVANSCWGGLPRSASTTSAIAAPPIPGAWLHSPPSTARVCALAPRRLPSDAPGSYAASGATFASPPCKRPAWAASTFAAASSTTWSSSSEPRGSVVRTCFVRAHSRAKPTLRSAHLRSSVTERFLGRLEILLVDRRQPRRPRLVAPEQLDPVLAQHLRAIQRAIGAAHEVGAVLRLALGECGDAERRGHVQHLRRLVVGRDPELGDALADPLGEVVRADHLGARQDHGKLLSAEPGRGIDAAHLAIDDIRDRSEHPVTD